MQSPSNQQEREGMAQRAVYFGKIFSPVLQHIVFIRKVVVPV
jgi:hypothetical protein